MADYIQEIEVKNWDQFIAIMNVTADFPLEGPLYAYRGQTQDWPLLPTLARLAVKVGAPKELVVKLERQLLEEFEKQAHLFVSREALADPQDWVSRWALMQHYRALTRLLDWSVSPFVALYFAAEQDLDHAGVIWAVHLKTMGDYAKEVFKDRLSPTVAGMQRLYSDPDSPATFDFVTRKTQTDRMHAQQTWFSASSDPLADHGHLIKQIVTARSRKTGWAGLKLYIPGNRKPEFLRGLRRMNVAAHTLFPGIDGLGRSLSEYARLALTKSTSDVDDSSKKDEREGS